MPIIFLGKSNQTLIICWAGGKSLVCRNSNPFLPLKKQKSLWVRIKQDEKLGKQSHKSLKILGLHRYYALLRWQAVKYYLMMYHRRVCGLDISLSLGVGKTEY